MNLFRLLLATACLGALVAALGAAGPMPRSQAVYLLLSGVVGLALGDAAYFRCLETLGARRGALLMALAPVFTAVLAPFLLAESIGWIEGLGMAVTIAGVSWVQMEEDPGQEIRGHAGRGVWFGVLGALGQSGGFILAKAGLGAAPAASPLASWAGGEQVPVDPLYGTLLRMVAGAGCMLLAAVVKREVGLLRGVVADRRALALTLGGTALGPVVGVWLSLIAVRSSAHLSVAGTLTATSPIFIIPIARMVHGHGASWRAWIGAFVAVGGVVLLSAR